MTWVRYYSKKIFGPYLGHMPVEKAQKWMAVMRMTYFFSASTLLILVLSAKNEHDKKQLEAGKPVIEDHSAGHRILRTRGAEAGIIYEYTPGRGLTTIEFNKDEYYQQIEKEALEKARNAQEEAIAEGRELPKDAIKLV